MTKVEVLSQLVGNCHKADEARWPLKQMWSTPEGVLIEVLLPPGKKRDILAEALLEGLDAEVKISWKGEDSRVEGQGPVSLLWRSRRR